MAAPDRDPIGKVCALLTALLEQRCLSYEQAAQTMKVDLPRARKIVRQCAREIPWLYIDRSARRHVLRLRGVGMTDATLEVGIAACLGASVATLFEGTRYHKGMLDALRFVVSTSPNPERFVDLERRFLFLAGGGEVAFRDRAGMLDQVARAVLERHPISFQYQSFDAEKPREELAEPWALAIHKHRLYVIGRGRDGSPWVWRFARIHDVRTQKRTTFEYPTVQEFNPSKLFEESFGIWLQPDIDADQVEIVLNRRWRGYAQAHRWHASQPEPIERPDGRVSIRLKVKVCRELKQWILGFGRDAEVLRPASLRNEIAKELRDAARLYETPPEGPANVAPAPRVAAQQRSPGRRSRRR